MNLHLYVCVCVHNGIGYVFIQNFEEIIVENFPNMRKEIVKSRKRTESHTG